jgi:hypothetical protein
MASVSRDDSGRRTVQFLAGDGRRRTIRLGNVTQKNAEEIKLRVERINAARIANLALDNETASWVAGVGDDLAAKLAAVGLIAARRAAAAVELGGFLEGYIIRRTDMKPRTRINLDAAKARLLDFFGADKPLRDITPPTPTTGCSGSACATPTAPPAARLSAPSSSSAPRSAPG